MADTDSTTTDTPKPRRAYVRKTATTAAATPKPKAPKSAKATKPASKPAASKAKVKTVEATDWKAQAEQIKSQAAQVARNAAGTAKEKTGSAMQGLARLISETADTVDAKLGPQYGDYARSAAETVAGAAKSLDEKDIDQLIGDARDFVRKSPAVAIGAAAIAGFVLMRLAKGSSSDEG